MQVTVLEATNLPDRPVVAIHTGDVRRQAKLEVNQPFEIPHPGTGEEPSIQFSLLSQLSSQTLPKDNSKGKGTECSILVKLPDGRSTEVKLRVRSTFTEHDCSKNDDSKAEAELAQEYLATHKLQARLQDLIQDVLRQQPDDPYRYMLEQLKVLKASGEDAAKQASAAPSAPAASAALAASPGAASSEAVAEPVASSAAQQAPLVPKPPAGPAPSGGAPRRSRNHANGVQQVKLEEAAAPAESAVVAQLPALAAEAEAAMQPPAAASSASEARLENRLEARKAARASISMLFRTDRVAQEVAFDQRCQVQASTARSMTSSVMDKAMDHRLCQVQRENTVAVQAKATCRMLYAKAIVLHSMEYRSAVARWAVGLAVLGAVNGIVADQEKRAACFITDTGLRRLSTPMPIVNLCVDSISWGACLQ